MPSAHASCCALALLLLAPAASAEPTRLDAQPQAPPASAAATPERGQGGSYAAAGVAFGLAAVGAGVGAVAGGIALSDTKAIESSCHAGVCPASARGDASTAKVLGNVSTASLIVGGAAALTGIVFLVVLSGRERSPASAPPGPRATAAPGGVASPGQGIGVRWTAGLGLGRLTLEARF